VDEDTLGDYVRVLILHQLTVEITATEENTTARDVTPTNALLMDNGVLGVATDLALNHVEVVSKKLSGLAQIHHHSLVDVKIVLVLNVESVNATLPAPTHVQLTDTTNHGVNGPNVPTHVEEAPRLELACASHHNMEENNAQNSDYQRTNRSAINSCARETTLHALAKVKVQNSRAKKDMEPFRL